MGSVAIFLAQLEAPTKLFAPHKNVLLIELANPPFPRIGPLAVWDLVLGPYRSLLHLGRACSSYLVLPAAIY